MAQRRLRLEDYTVGWVCALSTELAAAEMMLDEVHEDLSQGGNDSNLYMLGRISEHNVVVACLPAGLPGTNSAAAVAVQMKSKFTSIRFGLMVGIGGGVPSAASDIRLGDVVVSQPHLRHGGVIQFDFGKTTPSEFIRTGFLSAPPTILLNALTKLQANHLVGRSRLSTHLSNFSSLPIFARDEAGPDVLFESSYNHIGGPICESCSKNRIIKRTLRNPEIAVHYGTIASGNQVIRDGVTRDRLSSELDGVLCFEMEAAGLMNSFPCIVIRGICDYADSHKNKKWQPYAAATAAACAKEVLSVIPAARVVTTRTANEAIMSEMLQSTIDTMNPDIFLSMLSVVDQDRYISTIPPLDSDHPMFHWIFRNMDYNQWNSANYSSMLWLSGPPECNIHQVSSHIVDQEKNKALKSVLYFFCSTATEEESIVAISVHTLLYQIICCAPMDKRISIVKSFLYSLLKGAFTKEGAPNWKERGFEEKGSPNKNIERLLNSTANELWAALGAVLSDEQQPETLVVIDGLEKVEHQKRELIRGVHTFIKHLQLRTPKVKILLTSRPQAEIKEVLDGLPFIEHDMERKECLASLYFDNTRLGKISEEHNGSFEWLWTHLQYKEWSALDASRLLLVQGKPGSGKSTLTKYFKDSLREREPATKSAVLAAFLYSHREGELQRSHCNMLRSILYDILHQDEAFFYYRFQTEYRRQMALQGRSHGDLVEWDYESLKTLLLSLSNYSAAKRVYLIIDAVDESNDKDRRDILEVLLKLCSETSKSVVKVFIASRPLVFFERHNGKIHNFMRLQDHTKSDISNFASSFLKDLEFTDFLELALEYIVEHAQGVFLWVKLVKDELAGYDEQGRSREDIFKFLKSLPTELEGFYKLMLSKIGGNEADLLDGIKMFRFALFARRPLTVIELLHSLPIPDSLNTIYTPSDEYFQNSIPRERRIIHCGGNFLEVRQCHGNQSVQLIHQTVREFFLQSNGYVANSSFRIDEEDAHKCISVICIGYLMLCTASTTPAKRLTDVNSWTSVHFEDYARYLDERPFANYAIHNLKHHINCCRRDANALDLTSQFIDELTHNPAVYLLESWVKSYLNKNLLTHEQVGAAEDFRNKVLHAAVRNGLPAAAELLLKVGADINARDRDGQTPLSWAAAAGHGAVVKLLLATDGVDVNSKDKKYGQTPLSWAAAAGYEAVVQLLLAKAGVDPNSKDTAYGQTPLSWAAENGHEAVVKLLLAEDSVDPDSRDSNFGQTPLWRAAENGHEAVVKLLLAKGGVDPNSSDWESGRTPLWRAARNGHEVVVGLLLANGAIYPNFQGY